MTKHYFISVEGVEGVGKTTNMAFIESWLKERKIAHIRTREPGGTPMAEQLRDLLLSNRDELVDEKTELLLMFAARSQHISQVIKPALANKQWVVCDRFIDATYAYQGAGRGLSYDLISQLDQLIVEGLKPDITLYLDLDIETCLSRISGRGEADRFEKEQADFFERVRNAYLERAEQEPDRFVVIDASQSLMEVQADIAIVLSKLQSHQV